MNLAMQLKSLTSAVEREAGNSTQNHDRYERDEALRPGRMVQQALDGVEWVAAMLAAVGREGVNTTTVGQRVKLHKSNTYKRLVALEKAGRVVRSGYNNQTLWRVK